MNKIADPIISSTGQVYSLAGLKRLLKEVTRAENVHLAKDSTAPGCAAAFAGTVPTKRKIS